MAHLGALPHPVTLQRTISTPPVYRVRQGIPPALIHSTPFVHSTPKLFPPFGAVNFGIYRKMQLNHGRP